MSGQYRMDRYQAMPHIAYLLNLKCVTFATLYLETDYKTVVLILMQHSFMNRQ
jgi:hypothetical protein